VFPQPLQAAQLSAPGRPGTRLCIKKRLVLFFEDLFQPNQVSPMGGFISSPHPLLPEAELFFVLP